MMQAPYHLCCLVEIAPRVSTSEWLAAFSARARAVALEEPRTLAYQAATSVQRPGSVLCLERYSSSEALADHLRQPAHRRLLDVFTKGKMSKRAVLANCQLKCVPNFGFWERPDAGTTTGKMERLLPPQQVSVLALRFASPLDADAAIARLQPAAAALHNTRTISPAGPRVTVCGAGRFLGEKAKGDFDLRKGDVVFILAHDLAGSVLSHQRHAMVDTLLSAEGGTVAMPVQVYTTVTGVGFMQRSRCVRSSAL